MNKPAKRSRIFFYSFLFLVFIILGQISWWIFFQINQIDEVYDDVIKLSEHTRSTAVLKTEELLQFSVEGDFFLTAVVRMEKLKIISSSGDTSGFHSAVTHLLYSPIKLKYFNNWRIEFQKNDNVVLRKINDYKIYNWFLQQYPNLKIREITKQPRDYFIEPNNISVKSEFELQAISTVKKRVRMFISEGLFFVVLVVIAVILLYSTLQKEWLYTHQTHNFMLSVTHELKSPIASIKLYIETLLKRDPDKEKREEFLERALSDTDRLQDLVENILNASRLESESKNLAKQEVNISEIIENLVKNGKYLQSKRIVLDSSLNEDAWIMGNENQLILVFNNLIDNGLKYSKDQIEISLLSDDDSWYVNFTDHGIGISAEFKSLIFERFFRVDDELTRKSTGVGLGLYIVKKITELHNGEISVESFQGKGSTFTLKFPKIKDSTNEQ